MTHLFIRCAGCHARIKAPIQLSGQTRTCPGCGQRLLVRSRRPDDTGPLLVSDAFPAARTLAATRA
jgi:DNA-directed RNA polymerase subunit RPC12/RpoP